jgi:hypothetical protein
MEIELAAMEIDTAAKALKRWPDRRALGERRGARGRVRRGSGTVVLDVRRGDGSQPCFNYTEWDQEFESVFPSSSESANFQYLSVGVISQHGRAPRIVLASPCSGHGFKFASIFGEVLADLSTRQSTDLPIGLFKPERFISGPRHRR